METFSAKTLDFLFENRIKDSKLWFDEHRKDYDKLVYAPLHDLVEALAPHMLKLDNKLVVEAKVSRTISRIRRDTRFTHDKSIYRDNMWIVFKRSKDSGREIPSFYFDISSSGFEYGCGFYYASTGYMDMMRSLILSGDKKFKAAEKAFRSQKIYVMDGDSYKRNRYPDEPVNLQQWLNKKGVSFNAHSKDFDLLFSDKLADKLIEDFKLLKPIYQFLIHVSDELTASGGMDR